MQHTPARTRVCPDCDGFPTAAVTTGLRHRDGTRALLFVTCPACHGTGRTTFARARRVRVLAAVGR